MTDHTTGSTFDPTTDTTTGSTTRTPILVADRISVTFPVGRRRLTAVDDMSFTVARGETVALVGESGSGKSTVALALMREHSLDSGRIEFDGTDITDLNERQMKPIRRRLQMVLQDPYASLDPRMTVAQIVAEPLRAHRVAKGDEMRALVSSTLEQVGLPADAGSRYPGQFSGGQRQRISIARALVLNPVAIVADEPVSALDVSIQAQIVSLLAELQVEHDLAYLIIAHDLALVHHISDRVIVMYLGQIVETGNTVDVVEQPQHPYTAALLSATPTTKKREGSRIVLAGDPPTPLAKPSGCVFHTRCPVAVDRCRTDKPPLAEVAPGRTVACFFPGSVESGLTIGRS